MKSFIITLMMGLMLAGNANAQDIFKQILSDAKQVAHNPESNITIAKIAMFKVNTLEYIQETAFKLKDTLTTKFFDDQAYSMSSFVNSFVQEVLVNTTMTSKEKKQAILFYMDASCSNPLFNDPDKELTLSYVNDSQHQLTPFSLDTDWTKAYAAILAKKEQAKENAK